MNNKDAFDKVNKVNDIFEISSEIDKIKYLLRSSDLQELQNYLQELQSKYIVETAAYNMVHSIPPRSLEENALNCIDFLNTLLIKKSAEELEDNQNKE